MKKRFSMQKKKTAALRKKDKISKNKNFIQKLSNSFFLIKNNKLLFFFVILLTIIYLGASLGVMTYYWIDAARHEEAVFGYIESIPLDDPLSSPLGADPLKAYEEIRGVKEALSLMAVFLMLSHLLINGASWLLVKLMRSKDGIIEFIKSYVAVSLVYIVLFLTLTYITFTKAFANAMEGQSNTALNIIGWICIIVLSYFYFISLGLSTNSKLKEIPLKTLKNAMKPLTTLPTYLLSITSVLLFGFLIYYFLEGNFFILLFSVIMLFFSLAYNKVLFSCEFE